MHSDKKEFFYYSYSFGLFSYVLKLFGVAGLSLQLSSYVHEQGSQSIAATLGAANLISREKDMLVMVTQIMAFLQSASSGS